MLLIAGSQLITTLAVSGSTRSGSGKMRTLPRPISAARTRRARTRPGTSHLGPVRRRISAHLAARVRECRSRAVLPTAWLERYVCIDSMGIKSARWRAVSLESSRLFAVVLKGRIGPRPSCEGDHAGVVSLGVDHSMFGYHGCDGFLDAGLVGNVGDVGSCGPARSSDLVDDNLERV